MIDLHLDLLSIIYYSWLKKDDRYLKKLLPCFKDDNVSYLLANLYFMNPNEMEKEIGNHSIKVVEMFEKSTNLLKQYLPNTNVKYSIEGCDYIQDTKELEELYQLGLRNILLVWNNENKYGSGNKTKKGLTEEGKDFLRKAIDLGISIDLSHMNENTFYDTIKLIQEEKQKGKKVKVLASHSNYKPLCNHPRNLSLEQLKALKSVDGLLGLVSYTTFVKGSKEESMKEQYKNHIKKAVEILGIDNVGVSSDDMTFANYFFQENYEMIFEYSTIRKDIEELLKEDFTKEEIEKIVWKNAYNQLWKEEEEK